MRFAVRPMLSLLLLLGQPLTGAAQGLGPIHVGSVWAPLPNGAEVVPHPHGRGRFGGIRIRLEERLTLELATLPDSTTPLAAYVDSVASRRNGDLRPAWRLDPPVATRVVGRTAWVLRPRCGDCEAFEVYLDFPGTRLVAAWGVDGLPPLTAEARHRLAWAFLATLGEAPSSMARP